MITEDTDGYYVTVYYPNYLEHNQPFKDEIQFRARSVYLTWFTMDDGKIIAEAKNYSTAKSMQRDFAEITKRFLRRS